MEEEDDDDDPTAAAAAAFRKASLDRLGKLMKIYDGLERTEDKLLGLLEDLRSQEGILERALYDPESFARLPHGDGNGDGGDDDARSSSSSPRAAAAASNTAVAEADRGQGISTRKPPPPGTLPGAVAPTGAAEGITAAPTPRDPAATAVAEAATATAGTTNAASAHPAPTGRYQRRKRGRLGRPTTTDQRRRQQLDPALHNARHLETNRHAQLREQRVLARRRLEEALFADDDDDDDDDSSSSS